MDPAIVLGRYIEVQVAIVQEDRTALAVAVSIGLEGLDGGSKQQIAMVS